MAKQLVTETNGGEGDGESVYVRLVGGVEFNEGRFEGDERSEIRGQHLAAF